MKNMKSIKFKIAIVYIVLFGVAIFSVGYILKQVKLITLPEQSLVDESNKIFLATSTITDLYSSEVAARTAILSGKYKDINLYYSQLDSINSQIELIKSSVKDEKLVNKLDTVQKLLDKKKTSFKEIIKFGQKISSSTKNYDLAINRIYLAKEEIESKNTPLINESDSHKKKSLWNRLAKAFDSDYDIDSAKNINLQPKLADSLIVEIEKIFEESIKKENIIQQEILNKERSLLQENKNITDQLRIILENIEYNILNNSYSKINESQSIINNTTANIAWIGVTALITVILMGWIILRDINRTQTYKTELEVLNAEKEVLLRSKTMLLASVTHDIQTPLGSVLGFVELLDKTQLNDKQKEYIQNVKYSSQYIVDLVNDLIDFSKLENKKIKIDNKTFNFNDLIESTCLPLQPNAENKNINLKWSVDKSFNQNYVSDPYRIKQVLTNLITNAIKFTQEGDVEVEVLNRNDMVEITVTDSGIGIEEDQIGNIFEEFKQANSEIEKKFGGSGLGLNISLRMIELLGGEISVKSDLGIGSVFTILLPLIPSEQTHIDVENKISESDFKTLENKRILIIDDSLLQLNLMREVFEPLAKEVTTLNDASNIIDIMEQSEYDLILTDIQMPKIDGFELINIIRNNPKFASIPVIAMSGKRNLNKDDFTDAGFTDSHPKPIQLHVLLKLIQAIFGDTSNIEFVDTPTYNNDDIKYNYSLSGLRQFIQDDDVAMKNILNVFIDSTYENLKDIDEAIEITDMKTLGDIAHKMLPMFKQLEINSVVKLLEPLEDRSLKFKDNYELKEYISKLRNVIEVVLSEIKNIELN